MQFAMAIKESLDYKANATRGSVRLTASDAPSLMAAKPKTVTKTSTIKVSAEFHE